MSTITIFSPFSFFEASEFTLVENKTRNGQLGFLSTTNDLLGRLGGGTVIRSSIIEQMDCSWGFGAMVA